MYADRIELDPRVCNGRPVIRGTRIPVAILVDLLASGQTWGELLTGYPGLNEADVRAALEYASAAIDHTEFVDSAW